MTGYVVEFEGKQFDPNGKVSVPNVSLMNQATEAAELTVWEHKPDRFHGYVKNNMVTTWLGTKIGTIVRRSSYRNNLTGTRIVAVTIRGTNGAMYFGRFGADWEFVRLRKRKTERFQCNAKTIYSHS